MDLCRKNGDIMVSLIIKQFDFRHQELDFSGESGFDHKRTDIINCNKDIIDKWWLVDRGLNI